MAIYTYVSNKSPSETASRVLFSTGKDIVLGEAIDLTAPEVTEAGKVLAINLAAGSVAVPITNLNFPPVQRYQRVGAVAVAAKHT